MKWRRSVAPFSLLVIAVSNIALAEKPEELVGQEYLDTPQPEPTEPPVPVAPPADERKEPGYLPGYRREIGLSLSPHSPDVQDALPGGFQPPFAAPMPPSGFRFQVHGYMLEPLRMSIGKRRTAYVNQNVTTFHGDPVVAGGTYGYFDHSATVPTPWSHFAFEMGNGIVSASVFLGSWGLTESDQASSYFQLPSKLGFNSAFVTYRPDVAPVGLQITTGAFTDRYGAMSHWTTGAYAVSLIGAVRGIGSTVSVELPFEGDWTARIEGGLKGDINRVPVGLVPNAGNEYPQPLQGFTMAAHGHFGISYAGLEPTVHYIRSWSQDDRSEGRDDPATPRDESLAYRDGWISVKGADLRIDAKRFGYFYGGLARVVGRDTNTLSSLVSVLNSGAGKEIIEHFWGYGSNGNGALTLLGAQYSVSLGTLLRYPYEFYGDGPDLQVSVFGIYGDTESDSPLFDGRRMLKYGTELAYSPLSWLVLSGRADHVMPNLDHSSQSFLVLSPKLVFRSNWTARETLTLQYAGYVLGDDVVVNGDTRLVIVPSGNPDRHLLTLYGTLWW